MLKHRLLIVATALLIASPSVARKHRRKQHLLENRTTSCGCKAPHFTLKLIGIGSIGAGLGDPTASGLDFGA